jgi:hypothetical protein
MRGLWSKGKKNLKVSEVESDTQTTGRANLQTLRSGEMTTGLAAPTKLPDRRSTRHLRVTDAGAFTGRLLETLLE